MGAMASQITSLIIVYLTVYSDADQRKQSYASRAFVRGIHRWPVNSPHKCPVARKMFPCDDVIMTNENLILAILMRNYVAVWRHYATISWQRRLAIDTLGSASDEDEMDVLCE